MIRIISTLDEDVIITRVEDHIDRVVALMHQAKNYIIAKKNNIEELCNIAEENVLVIKDLVKLAEEEEACARSEETTQNSRTRR